MTFKDKYSRETTWHGKATVMSLYHLVMLHRSKSWTLSKTAEYFECSVGLVSENIRLVAAIHKNERILKCESRQEALKKLNG